MIASRRGFLGGLLGAAASLVLDPELALWVPGKKLISVPAPRPFSVRHLSVYDPGHARMISRLDLMYAMPEQVASQCGLQLLTTQLDRKARNSAEVDRLAERLVLDVPRNAVSIRMEMPEFHSGERFNVLR